MARVKSTEPTVVYKKLSEIKLRWPDRADNPNKMDDDKFNMLVEAIRREGFLQPVLINSNDTLFDGHHRYYAAQIAAAGSDIAIPCVVKRMDDFRGTALGIGMNRLRGELSLSDTSVVLQEVARDGGFDTAELSMLSGFTAEELLTLLEPAASSADVMDDAASGRNVDPDAPEKLYTLELKFSSKALLKIARKALKKAAGKGGDLSSGLLHLIGAEWVDDADEQQADGDEDESI
jgi:ParB-like chromosome segregation protein Spo0J